MATEQTLVERLRSYSEQWEKITPYAPEHWHGKAMAEAAAEIERLEKAVASAWGDGYGAAQEERDMEI
jgi:hypothetical protein